MIAIYLSLQLADCSCEIEHQFSDVFQLTLQDLDGLCLLLVLKIYKKKKEDISQHSCSGVSRLSK